MPDLPAIRSRLPLPLRPLTALCFSLFLLTTLPVHAEKPGWFERRAMSYAERAFQDGLYDVSILKLEEFQKTYPESELLPQGRWLLGQAYFFTGSYDKALDCFKTTPAGADDKLKANYAFWKAETLSALGKWDDAIAAYRDFLKNWPKDESASRAAISLSGALFEKGDTKEALAVLDPLLGGDKLEGPAQTAALQKVRILLGSKNNAEAAKWLDRLSKEKLSPEVAFEAAYWNGEVSRTGGNPEKAIDAYRKLTEDKRAQPRELVAKAWFGTGLVFADKQMWSESSDAFEKAFTLSKDPGLIEPAVVRYLEVNTKSDNLTKAALTVRQFARQNPDTALIGLYAIGKFYSDAGNYDASISELDNLVNSYPTSSLVWPSRLLMASALLGKKNNAAAAELFTQVGEQDANPDLAAQALIKLGEMDYSDKKYEQAAAEFQKAAAKAKDRNLAETALYRCVLAWAQAGNLDQMRKFDAEFRKAYPQSSRLAELSYEQGRLLDRLGKGDEARKLYGDVAGSAQDPERAANALLEMARSLAAAGDSSKARETLLNIEKNYPKFSKLDEVVYLRLVADLNAGNTAPAAMRDAFEGFITKFPDSPRVPQAHLQIANSLYSQGNYPEAQARFQKLAELFPKNPLANEATYLAGRCLMATGNFKDAIAVLEKIPDNSPLKTDARLAQIRCYMKQGSYEPALTIADSVIANNKDEDSRWVEASLRRAGCLYTLAADDSKRYNAALQSVDIVLASKAATVPQLNEAGFIKGEILQKLNQPTKALESFLDVVYGRLLPSEITKLNTDPEYDWFIKSGVAAARMREDTGDIRGAVEIYRILERLGDPQRQLFRNKIEELKSKHFLYEES